MAMTGAPFALLAAKGARSPAGGASGARLGAAMIAEHQRFSHNGITGFGTVAAFAKARNRAGDTVKLEAAVKGIHRGDNMMSELAESAILVAAVDD